MNSPHLPEGWQTLASRSDMGYTPDNIGMLRENEVFVFGSNLKGYHAGGAARTARRVFNAKMGVGEGMTGQAYAVPTLDEEMRRVSLEALRSSFERLLYYTLEHPMYTFYLTEVGCGIAGWEVETVRDLLWEAVRLISEEAYQAEALPSNLLIPKRFRMS